MQRLTAVKPKTVQTPIEVRFGAIHGASADIETVVLWLPRMMGLAKRCSGAKPDVLPFF
jgi:hypothetical protein